MLCTTKTRCEYEIPLRDEHLYIILKCCISIVLPTEKMMFKSILTGSAYFSIEYHIQMHVKKIDTVRHY